MLPAHFAILIGPPTTAPAPHGRGPNPHRATVERLGPDPGKAAAERLGPDPTRATVERL